MAAINGQQPKTAAVPIFAKQGQEFQLGEHTFNYKKFSLSGTVELRNDFGKLDFLIFPIAGATFGQMVVEGASGAGNFKPLHGLLSLITFQEVPENICDEADGSELVAAIDGFFEQDGMKWIDTILKNFIPRAETVVQTELTSMVDQALSNQQKQKSGMKRVGGTAKK